ncbi:DUF2637 domain-containing protein [Streptomyces sp. NPDC048664]|uniref:DUF2637 domain-containing protein n=1 Tax=Streptomyces sp. NPDC048664 TaxID=3154505 RepID=UPI00342634FB
MDRIQGEPSLYDIPFALRTDPYDTLGQHPYAVDPLGVDSYGSYGADPYDVDPYRADTYGVDPLGVDALQARHTWNTPGPDSSAISDISDIPANGWDPDEELAQMLATVSGTGHLDLAPPPLDGHHHHHRHRRPRPAPAHVLEGGQRVGPVGVLVATIAACAVALLGWSTAYSYGQLRAIASTVLPDPLALWWPLTVYGPWFVAALSILRAAFQHRTARRSWSVILLASATAVALCICNSAHSMLSMVIVGIPPVTALVCFRELVGQVTSKYRPRHAAPVDELAGA